MRWSWMRQRKQTMEYALSDSWAGETMSLSELLLEAETISKQNACQSNLRDETHAKEPRDCPRGTRNEVTLRICDFVERTKQTEQDRE